MDLHYSQTGLSIFAIRMLFHYLMDLHYSQTNGRCGNRKCGFTTLWIYTILKPNFAGGVSVGVSLPYGFTLFSNLKLLLKQKQPVSLPYGFTLFSNKLCIPLACREFHYLMDLHYSQTPKRKRRAAVGFTTLWIYTILKHKQLIISLTIGFTTLWIYTILKPWFFNHSAPLVSLPYGFTLFSNIAIAILNLLYVSLPYGFTLFSNRNYAKYQGSAFHYLMDLHYSQTVC